MLEKSDIEMIRQIMKEEISASEKRITNKIEDRTGLLLDEISRANNSLEKQMEQIKKNLEELQQYYRITKLENENTTLLLKMIEALQKDVEDLKKKIA